VSLGNCGGPVRRAVVDDEDVCVRKTRVQFVENGWKVLRYVPRGNKDERAASGIPRV
jgi:hypothetical protein